MSEEGFSGEKLPDNAQYDEQRISEIAGMLFAGYINDDNIVPATHLTGLEQAVYGDRDLKEIDQEDIEIIKDALLRIHREVKQVYAGGSSFPARCFKNLRPIYLKERWGEISLWYDFIIKNTNLKDYVIWIDELARGVVKGSLVKDPVRKTPGMTTLDRAIFRGTDLEPDICEQDSRIFEVIKLHVLSKVSEYSGGNNIRLENKEKVLKYPKVQQ